MTGGGTAAAAGDRCTGTGNCTPKSDECDPDRWRPDRCAHLRRGGFVPFGCDDRSSFLWTEFTVATITQRRRQWPTLGRVRWWVAGGGAPDRLVMVPQQRGV